MFRQKLTSGLLVFALAGVTAMAGCQGQQRPVRSSQVRTDQNRSANAGTTQQRRPNTAQQRSNNTTQQRSASNQNRRGGSATPATQRGSAPTTTRDGGAGSGMAGGSNAAPAPTPTRRGGWPTMGSNASMLCSAMAYPTGDAATSAVGIEKCVPREVRQNQPFTYDLIVTNLTGNPLSDVVVTEQPENGMRITGASPASRGTGSGLHTWPLGSFAPKESKTIRLNAVAATEGTIGSCASVSYASALCATIPVVSPRLRLTKTGPSEVLACDDITYSFEVSNTGTGSVRNVRINDPLPAGLVAADGSRSLTFDAGTLAAGQSRRFTGSAKAQRSGRFENRASATGEGGMSVDSGTVSTVVRKPALTITKTCARTQFIGKDIAYEITVTNTGDGEARDTIIEDRIANGLTFVNASDGGRLAGGNVVWNLGSLAPRASKTVTMRCTPNGAGTFRNTATARAYCVDPPASDSCETVVTGIPAILLEVIDIEDPVRVGDNETYVISVTNQGSAPDTNITITCTLEGNQTYVSASGATTGTARGNVISFAPVRSLAPKQKVEWRLVAKAVRAGDVRFKVSMNSDNLTRPVEETESTHLYE